jgi:ABC-type transport system substrate-binding protein
LVRKAFALSIDRDIYVEVTLEEGDLPGAGILPPGMPGYVSDSLDNVFDPQKAKELLFQSRYFSHAQTPPEIRFVLPTRTVEYDPTMEFLVVSWEKHLGMKVFVEGLSPELYRKRVKGAAKDQVAPENHCADDPDPENFDPYLFYGNYTEAESGYRNANLDALLDSAAGESDWTRRLDLYRRADKILSDDAPVIVLAYPGTRYSVWKVRVDGYVSTPIDVPQHQFLWLEPKYPKVPDYHFSRSA